MDLSSDPRLTTLISDIANSREEVRAHRKGISRAASPADSIKRSFQDHKIVFFGSAAALGLILALLPAGKRRVHQAKTVPLTIRPGSIPTPESRPLSAIVLVTVAKLAGEFLKPLAVRWIKRRYLDGSNRRL